MLILNVNSGFLFLLSKMTDTGTILVYLYVIELNWLF